MKVIPFYRSVISLASLVADDEGRVSISIDGAGTMPFLVKGQRMALPTREMMAADKSQLVLFHPLSENIMDKGESPVMQRYREALNITLNMKLGKLCADLLKIATSPAMQERLVPDQIDVITVLNGADEKTIDAFEALIKAMPMDQTAKCFVHFYIRKNGPLNGKVFRRLLVTSFPLYEELSKEGNMVYGVKLRKKDHAMFKALLETLLPNLDQPHHYNRGSTSDTHPTIEALLSGVLAVGSHINAIIEQFASVLPGLNELLYDTDCFDALSNLDQFNSELLMIPHQDGNTGEVDTPVATSPTHQLQNVASQPRPMPVPPRPHAPQHPAPGQPTSTGVVYDANGFVDGPATRAAQARMAQQVGGFGFQQPQQPVIGGFGQPPQQGFGFGQPVSGADAARMQQQPAYERTGHGPQGQPTFGGGGWGGGYGGNLPHL